MDGKNKIFLQYGLFIFDNKSYMDFIIEKLTNCLRKENIDNAAINDIIQKLGEYWLYLGVVDWDNITYIGILKAIHCAKFLKAKFNDDSKFSIMQKTIVYRDDDICIFKPTTFEESSIIGEPICCFAFSRGRWEEHYIGYEEAIYYVYDVRRDNIQDFVAITVRPNGRALVLDKNHRWWTPSESIKYIQELGKGAPLIVTKEGKPIKTKNNQQIKENKTMNKKQTIRLNESRLKRIVKESVEMVLKEGKYTNHVPHFPFSNRPYSMKAEPGQPVHNPNLSGPELEKHNTRAREKYYTDSNGNPIPYDPSERNPNYYFDLQREKNDPMVYWVHRAKKVMNSEIGCQRFVYDFYREYEDLM